MYSNPGPQGFVQAQTRKRETYISLLLPEHIEAVAPLISGSDFPISHRQGERGPEFLISVSSALQGSPGTQRRMTGPNFLEVQMETCYLTGEPLPLRSLMQLPSPEKTLLSSEEKPDLQKSVVLVSGCTVMQTSEFQEGQKWCIFPLLFSYSFPVVFLITLGS